MGHHKFWCGKSGEKCIDYEIRDVGEKGLGLFLKRNFKRGEKILVERAVAIQPKSSLPIDFREIQVHKHLMSATMALAPIESTSLKDKFFTNCSALGVNNEDKGNGLFLHFSRVNHDCVGNSWHHFIPDQQLIILVANREIPAGSEVTFNYFPD